MNRTKHPTNRAERLRLKYLKDTFDNKFKRSGKVRKRTIQEIETKELEDELRQQILGSKEEVRVPISSV